MERVLRITIPETHREFFNEDTQEFYYLDTKERTIVMEHSLISISKWEAKWKKPYLDSRDKTEEEVLDYLRCMTITPNVPSETYKLLTKENLLEIKEYIDDPMTATTIRKMPGAPHKKEIITSEIVYYWMIAQQIPIEFEKWHFNRLMMLIKVCAIKNDPKKTKMSRSAILEQNRALNKARRARTGSKG